MVCLTTTTALCCVFPHAAVASMSDAMPMNGASGGPHCHSDAAGPGDSPAQHDAALPCCDSHLEAAFAEVSKTNPSPVGNLDSVDVLEIHAPTFDDRHRGPGILLWPPGRDSYQLLSTVRLI